MRHYIATNLQKHFGYRACETNLLDKLETEFRPRVATVIAHQVTWSMLRRLRVDDQKPDKQKAEQTELMRLIAARLHKAFGYLRCETSLLHAIEHEIRPSIEAVIDKALTWSTLRRIQSGTEVGANKSPTNTTPGSTRRNRTTAGASKSRRKVKTDTIDSTREGENNAELQFELEQSPR